MLRFCVSPVANKTLCLHYWPIHTYLTPTKLLNSLIVTFHCKLLQNASLWYCLWWSLQKARLKNSEWQQEFEVKHSLLYTAVLINWILYLQDEGLMRSLSKLLLHFNLCGSGKVWCHFNFVEWGWQPTLHTTAIDAISKELHYRTTQDKFGVKLSDFLLHCLWYHSEEVMQIASRAPLFHTHATQSTS